MNGGRGGDVHQEPVGGVQPQRPEAGRTDGAPLHKAEHVNFVAGEDEAKDVAGEEGRPDRGQDRSLSVG